MQMNLWKIGHWLQPKRILLNCIKLIFQDKKILRKYTKGRGNAGIKTRITKSQDQVGIFTTLTKRNFYRPDIEYSTC